MSPKKLAHPPKKKHQTRPRQIPVVPLTDIQRETISNHEFARAAALATEAESVLKLAAAPSSCVHTAYFAMEHCACAAILRFGGVGKELSFPKKHQDIILHIERFTADETGNLSGFGDGLKVVYRLREAADYFTSRNPSNADAAFAVETMRKYLDATREKWKFISPNQYLEAPL